MYRKSFIILALISLATMLLGTFPGCAGLQEGQSIDLNAVNLELKAVHQDLGDMLVIVQGDDELEPVIQKFHDILGTVQEGLQGYIDQGATSPGSLTDTLQLALSLSEQLIQELADEEHAKKIQLGIFAARIVLRRIDMYLGSEPSNKET